MPYLVLTKPNICQQIVYAWDKVSVSTIVQTFMKAGIITEQLSNSNKIDWDNDHERFGRAFIETTQLLNSNTEDEEFNGFLQD